MSFTKFSPKDFLKSRHPERFSDTVIQVVPELDRAILEYHLETLTSRSEEVLFEAFSRALLERTVCPNLMAHTGPTGGGDSKVDSETYPVAEALALAWYIGNGNDAATERWAFAFSTKKDWRPKVEGDVGKIVATGRSYTKVFFVSSRYIRDKERARVEDEIRAKCGIDLRIFDRMWILDKVFGGRFEQLAIDTLKIETLMRRQIQKGPRDTAREQDLQAIEDAIAAASRESRWTTSVVEDCLTAADLARTVERPRAEVEGLYARAERLAKRYGTQHQQLQCAYDRAWTTFWWYEDFHLFAEFYAEVERRATGSRNAYDLELWTNSFVCLHTAVVQGTLQENEIDLQRRAASLIASLDQLISDQERPTASLQAQTLKLQVQLLLAAQEERVDILRQLAQVVSEAQGLIGYPFEPIAQIVMELGRSVGHLPGYQELFEVTVQAASRRAGDLSAARMLLSHGAQQLDSGRYYEAIRTLGRAMGRLFKNESRDDAVYALYLCSYAYEKVGLLWAARGTALAAAAVATSDFWTFEKVTPQQALCFNRVKWLELRLGRIGHLLAWHELDLSVRSALNELGYSMQRLTKEDEMFDPILGMLLLRADLWELGRLTALPDVLQRMGLPLAALALLYALGHEDKILVDLVEAGASAESRTEFFKQWRDQPAETDLPPHPLLNTGQTISLESRIAGCQIVVNCWNAPPCVELAESLLASLEALLATAVVDQVVAREPELEIKIRLSEFAEEPFAFELTDNDGKPSVGIRCRAFCPHKLTTDEQGRLKNRLLELISHITDRVFLMKDPESLLKKLFRDDLAPQRALDFATSFVVAGNVLGDKPRVNLDSWTSCSAINYRLIRNAVWDSEDQWNACTAPVGPQPKPASPNDESSVAMRDLNQVSHTQIRTVSLIRALLWDEASWVGAAFVTYCQPSIPPILALVFRNRIAAAKIFAAWRSELGASDQCGKLRLAIVRKISKSNPHWYRIIIGAEPTACFRQSGVTQITMMSRIHTMTPASSENLDRFLNAYKTSGKYLLSFAQLDGSELELAKENQLEKGQIVVRDAWQIGSNDPDIVAIRHDDDPIVPDGLRGAPVEELLERIRSGS